MRILYVTSRFPYPLTSGALRHFYFLRELARRHEVTFVSLTDESFDPAWKEALAGCVRIETVQRPAGSQGDFRLIAGIDSSLIPLREVVARIAAESTFDVAVLGSKRVAWVADAIPSIPKALDLCDVESVRIRGRLQHASWLARPRLLLAWLLMRLAERRVVPRVDHTVLASVRDLEAFSLGRSFTASVVPNGVDLEFWKRARPSLGHTIVFTGAMNYRPNVDAALFLVREIFPLVREAVPDAELRIVGRDPVPELVRAGETPGIDVTGLVDDMRLYLEEAAVFAAPIRFGAGIQNKVLEALAMGLPTVASSIAADGLRTSDGANPPLEIAETPREFADKIVRRLRAGDRTPSAEARSYVKTHFQWEACSARLEEILRRTAQSHSPEPAPVA
jgi:glycosyltransferase involved in cell wall biosynthesis